MNTESNIARFERELCKVQRPGMRSEERRVGKEC